MTADASHVPSDTPPGPTTPAPAAPMVRVVNLRLLARTLLVLAVVVPCGYYWHSFQLRRIATALMARADALAQDSDWRAAADYVFRYLQIRPDDAQARIRLARHFDKSATDPVRRQRAIDLYYQAIGVAPDEELAGLRRRVSELLLESGRFTEAEREARQLIAARAGDAASRRVIALALYGQALLGQRGKDPKTGSPVGEALALAVSVNPHDVQLAATWAAVLREQPDLLSQAQRRTLLTEQARTAKADEVLDQLVKANPEDPQAYIARYQYRSRYQLAGAEDDLARALQCGTDQVDVALVAARHYQQAAAAARQRGAAESEVRALTDEAEKQYRRVADKLDPKNAIAYLGLGEVYLSRGETEAAIKITQQGLEQVGESDPALNARLAEQLIASDRVAEAEQALRRLEQATRQQGLAGDTRRLAWDRSRNLLQAAVHLKKAEPLAVIPLARPIAVSGLSDANERLRARLLLGDSYAQLGLWDQAAAAYENAAGTDPRQEQARVAAATAWLRADQPERAAELFKQALVRRDLPELRLQWGIAWLAQQSTLPPHRRQWAPLEQMLAQLANGDYRKTMPDAWRVDLLQADYALAREKERGAEDGGRKTDDPKSEISNLKSEISDPKPDDPKSDDPKSEISNLKSEISDPKPDPRAPDPASQPAKTPPDGGTTNDPRPLTPDSRPLTPDSSGSPLSAHRSPLSALRSPLLLLRAAEQHYADVAPFWGELALRYERLGQRVDADRALAECGRLDDRTCLPRLVASRLYAGRKDYDRARRVLREGLTALPAGEHTALRLALAQVALLEGKLDEASRELAPLAESGTPNLAATRQLAELALDDGDLQAAQRWEQRLQEMEGPDGTYWRYVRARRLLHGLSRTRDPRFQEAEQLQGELLQRRPSWPTVHTLQGSLAEVRGQTEQAIEAYQTAIRQGEQRLSVYERLVSLLYRQGRFAEADDCLARLSEQIPASESLSPLAISVATGMKDVGRAQALAKQAVDRRPQDPMTWVWYGQVLLLDKKQAEAEQAFRKAVEVAPQDVRSWSGLFSFQMRTDQRQAAAQTLQELAKKAKLSDAERAFVLAQGHEMLDDTQQADRNYRQASQLAADSIAIWSRFAAFLLRHDSRRAEEPLRRVVDLAQRNEATRQIADNARRTLAALLAARGDEGDFDAAMRLLQQTGDDQRVADLDQRLQAVLLTQRTKPDLARAQLLLEDLVQNRRTGADGDHLLLAWVYVKQSESLTGDARKAKLAAARQQYETLCVRSEPKPAHLMLYVDFLLEQSLWPEADRMLQRLETLAGGESGTMMFRARWLDRQGRTAEIPPLAEAFAQRREKETGDDAQRAEVYAAAGRVCSRYELHEAAEAWYRKAVALDPKRYALLANALIGQGKDAEAIQLCRQEAEKTNSPDAAGVLATALVAAQAGEDKLQACQGVLDKALATYPEDPNLLLAIANFRVLQRRTDEAVALYRSVLRLSPKNLLALNNLATLLSESPGKADEALRYIERAIQLTGPEPALLDTKGMVFVHDGRPEDAVKILQQAAAAPRADPRYHFHLAVALQRVGDVVEARTAYQTALDKNLRRQMLTETDERLLEELEKLLRE